MIGRVTPATLARLGSPPVVAVVVPLVVVSVVAASWLLLSASPELASVVSVVPVGSPLLSLADQDQEEGEKEESEEESHVEISQVSG